MCAVVLVTTGVAQMSAHRRDEYLQAARIAMDPGRVEVELDLTPGIALADVIIRQIDRDRSGSFSDDEMRAYALSVMHDVSLELDGRPLQADLASRQFPATDAIARGEGIIRLRLTAPLPSLSAGGHRLLYRNSHQPTFGVYLANALAPASDQVAVVLQRRDVDQKELLIEYEFGGRDRPRPWWQVFAAAAGIGVAAGLVTRRRRPIRA